MDREREEAGVVLRAKKQRGEVNLNILEVCPGREGGERGTGRSVLEAAGELVRSRLQPKRYCTGYIIFLH